MVLNSIPKLEIFWVLCYNNLTFIRSALIDTDICPRLLLKNCLWDTYKMEIHIFLSLMLEEGRGEGDGWVLTLATSHQ